MSIRRYIRMGTLTAEVVTLSNSMQRSSYLNLVSDRMLSHDEWKELKRDIDQLFKEHNPGEGDLA